MPLGKRGARHRSAVPPLESARSLFSHKCGIIPARRAPTAAAKQALALWKRPIFWPETCGSAPGRRFVTHGPSAKMTSGQKAGDPSIAVIINPTRGETDENHRPLLAPGGNGPGAAGNRSGGKGTGSPRSDYGSGRTTSRTATGRGRRPIVAFRDAWASPAQFSYPGAASGSPGRSVYTCSPMPSLGQ